MILLSFPLITKYKSQSRFITDEEGTSFNHLPSRAVFCLALETLHTLTGKSSTFTLMLLFCIILEYWDMHEIRDDGRCDTGTADDVEVFG